MRSTYGLSHEFTGTDQFLAVDPVQWTIFGKFSVFLIGVDACFFSADSATEARCTASMGGTTTSGNSTAGQPSNVIGGAAKRSARPLLG
jgi:hypothetical protein